MEKLDLILDKADQLQSVTIELLSDTILDYKKKDLRKDITIWVLIASLVGGLLFFQWRSSDAAIKQQEAIERLAQDNDKRFKDFLSEYDFETTYEQNLDLSDNSEANDTNKIEINK